MTGIAQYNRNFMDSPEERYLKLKQAAETFRIIQLGIVPWKKSEGLKDGKPHYVAKPYNIYVFPSEDYGNSHLNCEVSAMIFNREHGMDFNKWICKGVTYLNSKQFKHLSENLMDNNINNYDPEDPNKYKNIALYKEEDRCKYNEFAKKFSEFFFGNEKSFKIERLPRFFMLYIINNLQPQMRKSIYISYETIENKNYISFTKVNEEERKALIEKENEQKIEKLHNSKGVKNLFDAIIKNMKPIIGHNMSLDVLYCLSHFEDPLPQSYIDFKKMIQNYFGGIYDTKLMYNSFSELLFNEKNDIYDSGLDTVYEKLQKKFSNEVAIEITNESGFTNYLSENVISNNILNGINTYHQADYDGFVTGCAFVYMKEMLKDESKIENLNFKVNNMKSFYHCFDFKNEEEFECPNSIPYCLKSKTKSCEFQLDKILSPATFTLIKKSYYVEGYNSMLVFVDLTSGAFTQVEKELINNGKHYFDVLTLSEFKKRIKEEDENKKMYNRKK